MIYTVTFNPSLDYIVTVENFAPGKTNRTDSELMLPGGKGINVSIVLSNLGVQNTAIYFAAGFVGEEITRRVEESGIRAERIPVEEGCSRINLKMRSYETGGNSAGAQTDRRLCETEINGRGPVITPANVEELYRKLDQLQAGDTLVLAGSIPGSMPQTIYSDILERLSGRGIRFVVDATGELLLRVLQYHPFLVKPNHHELGELFGVTITTRDEAIPYAKKLQEMGAQNVIVSMAGEGAVLVTEDRAALQSAAPQGTLVNAVGAGDSMVS
ncbi:MAG: 1-phosphofructokinase family hexose kinase [Eubacterium sp.]|nr:1-phosphofructokinase family hexose kinase [Eubacterium sp.]